MENWFKPLGTVKDLLDEKIDTIMLDCEFKDQCSSIYDLKNKIKQDKDKIKEFEKVKEAIENKYSYSAFEYLLPKVASSLLFGPIQNFYLEKLKDIPEVKLCAIGEVDDSIDIWTLVLSSDIRLRHKIAGYHIDIMKIWKNIDFEFLTIPISNNEEMVEWEKEEISDMEVFFKRESEKLN